MDSTNYYYSLAMKPKENADFLVAYDFFTRQKEVCLKNNNSPCAIYNLGYIAVIQNESGFYYDSENSSIEGLSLIEDLEESDFTKNSKITFYNQLGKVNRALNNYDLAMLYYDKALEITEHPKERNKIINNRALIYSDRNQFDKALVEFETAYAISLRINNDNDIARNLDNLGYVKSKLNHKDALILMDSALRKRLELKDYHGTFSSYNHLAKYYRDRGNTAMAKSYLNKALVISENINSDAYTLQVLSELMLFYDDPNVTYYKELNDKIKLENLLKQSKYASRKYAYENHQKKAKANALKFEKEKSNKIVAFSIASLIALLAMFLYYFLNAKHKKEKLQQVFDTESRISKKIHDEVANDVFQLMTKLEHDDQIDADVIDELHSLYYRTRDISKEHGALNDSYPFVDHLRALIESYHDSQTTVVVKGLSEISWTVFPEIQRITVYKVLQELLINMKKHSQAIIVVLVFQQEKRKLSISYSDNGVGTDLKIGNGLQNTENRIQAINGTITFETNPNKGFKAKINI
jgi:signal transduction histidine kinase